MDYKDLKILLVSPLPPPAGGISSWTEQYIDWAKKNNLSVVIVNQAVIGKRAENITKKTRISDEIKRTKFIIKELRMKINQFKPQIIHLNTSCGKLGIIRDFLCAQIAKKSDAKLIVHYHCNIKDQVDSSIVSRFFLRQLANIADLNLVLNNSSKQYLFQKTNRDSILIPNFIHETFVLDKSRNIRKEIKIVSFVGHVQRTKGVLEIIDVAKKLPDIIFKIAGPVANEIVQIEKPKNTIFLGPITKQKVKKLLMESDVFLFPSHTEGFSNALLEAMAMGLPIITTPVGANVDMIESKGGVIVNVGDSNSIMEAIDNIKDSMIRAKMSEWNLNKVKNEYTTEKIMNKLITLYLYELNK